jgi:hypothetical protein
MDLKGKTLERIINNENTVTQLESLYSILSEELGGCKNYYLSGNDCRKYGVDMPSLISGILSAFMKVKEKEETK